MKSVLVTGAGGFIGRYAAREFANNGYSVTGIGRGDFPEYRDWGISNWHECDINFQTLSELSSNPDVILHCAGGSSVNFSLENPREDFLMTVDTTSQVLEYIRRETPQAKLIYPSTAAVYGEAKVIPIRETAPLYPVSPYGVHKLMAENLCQLYARTYDMSISIVRLFSVYGDGLKKQLLWDASNKLISSKTRFFGTGDEIRDWLHVSDVVSLLSHSVNYASPDCPIVNGGSGEGVTVRDILKQLFVAFGRDDEPEFQGALRQGDPSRYIADITSAIEWGWTPKINWQDGVTEYAQWYRGHES